MNKEKFIEAKKDINLQISKLRDLEKQLISDYIESNKKFNIGDRVKNIKHNEFGFVNSFDVDWMYNVKSICKKEKKDGTQSLQKMYVFDDSQLEIANK